MSEMEKTAVLLVNLGTPEAPEPGAVRRYLRDFLSDRRVIDLPRWQWLPILHGIILRVRPKKSAALYQSIWTEFGSPLMINSRRQQTALQERLVDDGIRVALAMNYGKPSIASEMDKLHDWGVRRLIVLPLFPQYSSTTTASVWDGVQRAMSGWRDLPGLTFLRDYPDHPKFIEALVQPVKTAIAENGKPDALIFSYHGIPQRYADAGDDYPSRCRKTTDALKSQLPGINVMESFQSKFGNEKWLEPATDETLRKLADNGENHVLIIAPGFTADCVETLHELQIEYADVFHEAGGTKYHYLPAVNDSQLFIDCLEEIVRRELGSFYCK